MTSEGDPRLQLRLLALMVNEMLTSYIELENKITRSQATFRSLVARLLGRRIPYEEFVRDLAETESRWSVVLDMVAKARQDLQLSTSVNEQRFVEALWSYTVAVRDAVAVLGESQRQLERISLGSNPTNPTFGDIAHSQALYRAAVQRYLDCGIKLNSLNPLIFD